MGNRIRILKRNQFLILGVLGCLIFTAFLFLGFNNSILTPKANIEKNYNNGIKFAADEANIIFSSLWASQSRAEPFEIAYIYCMVVNQGNTTAFNISISLLSKLDNGSAYTPEQVQNCSPLARYHTSPVFEFPVQKSTREITLTYSMFSIITLQTPQPIRNPSIRPS